MSRVFAALFALASTMAAPARADVVTNGFHERQVHLVWIHEARVVLGRCLDNTTVFNHDTCHQVIYRAPAPVFIAKLAGIYEADLPRAEKLLRETWINLEQVDTRLMELVATVMPDPTQEVVTVERLEAAARTLAAADGEVATTRDQIARVQEELVGGDADPELLAQLEVLKKALKASSEAAETRRAELSVLRRRYVAQRALEGDADFNDLKAMRNRLVSRLESTRLTLRSALDQAARGATMARRVVDTFSWDETSPTYYAHPVVLAVESAERATRTFKVENADPLALMMLEIPRQGFYEGFKCSFAVRPSPLNAPMSCRLLIATGGDHVRAHLTNMPDGTLEFRPQPESFPAEYDTLLRLGLITPIVREALFAFHLECTIGNGGTLDGFGPGSCALTFKRE